MFHLDARLKKSSNVSPSICILSLACENTKMIGIINLVLTYHISTRLKIEPKSKVKVEYDGASLEGNHYIEKDCLVDIMGPQRASGIHYNQRIYDFTLIKIKK